MLVEFKDKSQITIPKTIVDKLKLRTGDRFDMEISDDGKIVLVPVEIIDKSQSWFWTKEWQHDEQQAQEDIESNRIYTSTNVDEFLKELKKQ
jgi:antitoxin MazE